MNRITILYDAFGMPSDLTKDWGFSALIECDGKRILFDAGNNAEFFRHNVETLKVDLSKLDFVVLSHRHGDHISGLSYVLNVNPQVAIYTPYEVSGFGTPVLPGIVAAMNHRDPSLPHNMHYFDGVKQEPRPSGSPWPAAHFHQLQNTIEVSKDIHLITLTSDAPGTRDMYEVSLAIRTPKGVTLVVGCSHPGIEKIVEAAAHLDERIYTVIGGFHLLSAPSAEVSKIASALHDKWKVESIAPGHCTGMPAFAALKALYRENYLYAGLGSILALP